MCEDTTARIRELNDRARLTCTGCRVIISLGVAQLGDLGVHAILRRVQLYDDFTADNDPYGEHDFGSFRQGTNMIFWRFDYYDLDFAMHSPDPADETVTARVLTIMLAEEY